MNKPTGKKSDFAETMAGQFQIAISATAIEQTLKTIIDSGYDLLLMNHSEEGHYYCGLISREDGAEFAGYGSPLRAITDAVKGWIAFREQEQVDG